MKKLRLREGSEYAQSHTANKDGAESLTQSRANQKINKRSSSGLLLGVRLGPCWCKGIALLNPHFFHPKKEDWISSLKMQIQVQALIHKLCNLGQVTEPLWFSFLLYLMMLPNNGGWVTLLSIYVSNGILCRHWKWWGEWIFTGIGRYSDYIIKLEKKSEVKINIPNIITYRLRHSKGSSKIRKWERERKNESELMSPEG